METAVDLDAVQQAAPTPQPLAPPQPPAPSAVEVITANIRVASEQSIGDALALSETVTEAAALFADNVAVFSRQMQENTEKLCREAERFFALHEAATKTFLERRAAFLDVDVKAQ